MIAESICIIQAVALLAVLPVLRDEDGVHLWVGAERRRVQL